jgi:hypothetical protein
MAVKKRKINSKEKIKETKVKREKAIEENKEDEEKPSNVNKQILFVLLIMGILILSIFIGVWISNEAKKIDYIGITFQKEMFGKIPIYTAQINGFNKPNGEAVNFKLALRNDPSKSNVPVTNELVIIQNRPIYVSINTSSDLNKCPDTNLALVELGQFMGSVGIVPITGVNPNSSAKELNKEFIDCNSHPDSTKIIITTSNETKIEQNAPNCYTINIGNCEATQAIERFEIATIARINHQKL